MLLSDGITLSDSQEQALRKALRPRVTAMTVDRLMKGPWIELSHGDERLETLGIDLADASTRVAVRSLERPIGAVRITGRGDGSIVLFDNTFWSGRLMMGVRLNADDCVCLIELLGAALVGLPNVYMRAAGQGFFWGVGATAVECRAVELEGVGAVAAIGDDALISSGVFIRNGDMHTVFDLETGRVLNKYTDTIVERHVWFGQDVLLIACERVGYGAVLGARSMVRAEVPPKVIVAGTPARVLRENCSWGRAVDTISPRELALLAEMDKMAADADARGDPS